MSYGPGRPKKGEVRPPQVREIKKRKGGPRPHTWITGPDEEKHDMYHPWQLVKAQAKFRGEDFNLTFEDFYELWEGYWKFRGRDPEDLCMTRKDSSQAWSRANCSIITRREHLQNQGFSRKNEYRKYNRKTPVVYSKMRIKNG
jgi:hypothetical protein